MAGEGGAELNRIDWPRVRQSIARNDERVKRVLTGDPALFTWVLDLRADELARPVETAAAGEPFLTVSGTAGRYMLPLARVREVAALRGWTPLPGAPPHLLGLTHCAGDRHLLLDLDALVDGAPAQGENGVAVLLRDRRVALRVAAAQDVASFTIPDGPPIGRHIRWVAPDGTALLDLDSILDRAHWGRRE